MRAGWLPFAVMLAVGCNTVLGNEEGIPIPGPGELGGLAGRGADGQCLLGFGDCNGDPRDGCEADLSEPSHCGACETKCLGPTALCATTQGRNVCTSGCPAEAPLLCGYQCVDRMTNSAHCGSCDHACGGTNRETACVDGKCQTRCEIGFHVCRSARGESCAKDDDPKACGASCAVCPDGPHGTASCDGKGCVLSCSGGFADCDGQALNGCEASVLDDPQNCGGCGRSCGARRCVGGLCVPVP